MTSVNVNVELMQAFVIINSDGIMINVGVTVRNWLDKGVCDKGFIWNPSNCECECDKSSDVGEYLDYENCKWKKIVDILVEECTETVEEVKIAKISLSEDKINHKCCSCTLHIVEFLILFTINVGVVTYFVYFHWYLKNDVSRVEFGIRTQKTIY